MKFIIDVFNVLKGCAFIVYESDETMIKRAIDYAKEREIENLNRTLKGARERQVAFDECVTIRKYLTAISRGQV